MTRIPMDEQETTISFSRIDDTALISTTDSILIRKLKSLEARYPNDYMITDLGHGIECVCPKDLIKYGHSPSPKLIENGKRVARLRDEYIAREKAKFLGDIV